MIRRQTEPIILKFHLSVPVAIIPAATVRLPRPEADPAEVGLAVLVLANHVVTAAVLLDGHVALRTLFRVRRYPV